MALWRKARGVGGLCLTGGTTPNKLRQLFEIAGSWNRSIQHHPVYGNPVRIGDGCATVSGDKLPRRETATDAACGIGKAGARFEARSQDTGWRMLIMAQCAALRRERPAFPSKRRMRPAARRVPVRSCMPSFPTFGRDEGFLFSATSLSPAPTGLSQRTCPRAEARATNERDPS